MNEQQLADLFSEQIDKMLLGEEFSLPEEAADLHELAGLGQQFSNVNFQAEPAAQTAFLNQIATWFTPTNGTTATFLGLTKGWVTGLGIIVVAAGLGLGALLLTNFADTPDNIDTQAVPAEDVEVLPDDPIPVPEQVEGDAPSSEATKETAEKSSSAEDTIVPQKPSSLGDELPPVPAPSLGDTIIVPTTVPSDTAPAATESGSEIGAAVGENADSVDVDSGNDDDVSSRPEDDRGHGNDPGGFDPDNPGNSSGVPDKDSGPNLGKGDGGGSSSSGGKSDSQNKGKNENRGKGDK